MLQHITRVWIFKNSFLFIMVTHLYFQTKYGEVVSWLVRLGQQEQPPQQVLILIKDPASVNKVEELTNIISDINLSSTHMGTHTSRHKGSNTHSHTLSHTHTPCTYTMHTTYLQRKLKKRKFQDLMIFVFINDKKLLMSFKK